jgi:PAS domain S-box-containing protein
MKEPVADYLNPIARLGRTQYSFWFPLLFSLAVCILSEIFALHIAKNPSIVGAYIIWVNVASIMYFAFRDGIQGGIITAVIAISYYFYIIYTRHYSGTQFSSGVETTLVLGILYMVMAGIIGWLKQTIDRLIESEANEKRRLQAIVEQLPVGVTITDNQGRVIQVNKKVESILGTRIPLGYEVGKGPILPTEVRDGKQYTPSQGPLGQVLAKKKTTVTKDFIVTRKDGKRIYLQASASAIHNSTGKLIAVAQIVQDTTQQKELEKRKDDFVNMASHELKTPITSMKLYIDLLAVRLKKFNDERALKTLGSINQQTERLQELVNDLLDVSRIQTGKLTFTKEEFRLDKLVAETIEDLRGMAKQQQITFSGKTPIKVKADRFRIYQVITNLVTNAVKYSADGKEIRIKVKRNGSDAIVSVEDFGIGIAREQQKKVFERLYQVMDDKGKTFPGFGMGLYISKEIITRHKGKIWVVSEKGKGSTFYFTLPL